MTLLSGMYETMERVWTLHTIFLHVDFEALGETASLALIPSGHIHHTSSVFLAYVVQVTVKSMFFIIDLCRFSR